MGRGDGEGAGRGKRGSGQMGGGEKGARRGNFTDGYEEPARNEATGFSDFVYPCNAGYPS